MTEQSNFEKFGKDAPFADPVVRCGECRGLVKTEYLRKNGTCACGNRKVYEVKTLKDDEIRKLRAEFPDFCEVFEQKDTTGAIV